MKRPSCILVPVDCSNCSMEALDLAATMADWMESKLVVIKVAEPRARALGHCGSEAKDSCTVEYIRSFFNDRLQTFISSAPWPIEKLPKVIVKRGKIVEEILRAAKDEKADMIVMGTHGRRGLGRAVIGSVTERVIRRAPCPVLALRANIKTLAKV